MRVMLAVMPLWAWPSCAETTVRGTPPASMIERPSV